jgi:hyaluronoglucosaminidase
VSTEAAFAIRGVIEGFYGRPWSQAQRRDLLERMGAWGMNLFLVAPKDDPWHRHRWHEPFTDVQLEDLAALVASGRQANVEVAVALAPGLTIRYSDESHCTALVDRARQLSGLGVRTVGLLLDDIPTELQHPQDRVRYSSLVSAHVDLARRFHAQIRATAPGIRVLICPLVYRGTGTEPYITELGRALPDDVDLLWTGRQICSEVLATSDARTFLESTGHRPLYWDNYPVNDVAMTHELHIGPVRGRDADLGTACAGLLANPMPLYSASLIPLSTIGEYLSHPQSYEPDVAWERAVRSLVAEPADADAFLAFGRCVYDSCLNDDAMPEVGEALARAAFAWRTGELATAVDTLRTLAHQIAVNTAILSSPGFCNPSLQSEVAPWVAKYAKGGEAFSAMAESLEAAQNRPLVDGHPDCGPEHVRTLKHHLARLADDRYRVFGDGLQMTLAELVDEFEWVAA